MQLRLARSRPEDTDLLILPVAPGLRGASSDARAQARPVLRSKDFVAGSGDTLLLFPQGRSKPKRTLLVGTGDDPDAAAWRQTGGAAAKAAAGMKGVRRPAFLLPDSMKPAAAEALFLGLLLGDATIKVSRDAPRMAPELTVVGAAKFSSVLARTTVLARAVESTRQLVAAPASSVHPESMEQEIRELEGRPGFTVEVWDEAKLKEEKMGCILAVGRGSIHRPRLIIVRYRADDPRAATVLVGKGVCFDSGGYNLKATGFIEEMHIDMTGVATILGALRAHADLGRRSPVIAVFPLVENLISDDAYKPGDILTARNGLTVEVNNTDAEGRLILADALALASEWRPRRIVDCATLTGACLVALGDQYNGLFTADDGLAEELLEAGRVTNDPLWRLPLHPAYAKWMEGSRADLRNLQKVPMLAGASTAAEFLRRFVPDDIPYAHIDLSAAVQKDASPPDIAGPNGAGVRMLVEFLRRAK